MNACKARPFVWLATCEAWTGGSSGRLGLGLGVVQWFSRLGGITAKGQQLVVAVWTRSVQACLLDSKHGA